MKLKTTAIRAWGHSSEVSSSQRHTLPKQENMHSISEVIIILNNDQHQHKKPQQQTTGLIQRLSNNMQLLSISVIVS